MPQVWQSGALLHLCVGQNLTSVPEITLSKQRVCSITKSDKCARGRTKQTKGLQHQSKTALQTNREEPLFVVRNRSFPYKVELLVNGQPIPP